jgi:3-oxoacyl-[acyl-carrier protein] reductase
MSLSQKNILVVGGSAGIGLSLIQDLDTKGANIYNASRSKSDLWPTTVKHLDLDVMENLETLPAFLPEALHGIVYSVGSITLKPFSRLTAADFLKEYQLNVVGAAMVIQQSLGALKAAKGASIVLISSVAANTGLGFHASIAAAKGGLQGFALALAAEHAAQQIRVNVIAPSLTDTNLAKSLLSTPEKQEAAAKRHPLGRYGKPSDIAAAISFLLNDESSWITGQVLGIDGGMGNLRTNF